MCFQKEKWKYNLTWIFIKAQIYKISHFSQETTSVKSHLFINAKGPLKLYQKSIAH